MAKKFTLTIDGRRVTATTGETILDVALRIKVDIPHLCKHPDLSVQANCRMCVVEIDGCRDLRAACSTPAQPGMKVITDNPRIRRARKFNLELIFAEHIEDCHECVWNSHCDLLKYRAKYNSKMLRFPDRKGERNLYTSGPIIFDATKCIDCRNCVEVCPTGYYEISGRGTDILVRPTADKNRDCIYCGQCVVHCPAGAIKSAGEDDSLDRVAQLIADQKKIVVAQFAPSIRVSIGEELGLPYGAIATDLLTAGLKKLGFDYVFDTSVGADFTTVEEAGEAVERIKSGKNLPIMTSCCPSWVRYVEVMEPRFVKNLSGARSPQIMLGGLIKNYWAKKNNIDLKNLVSVSVMPCTSKKFEAERKELNIDGYRPVDIVLTTRELAKLFLSQKINLKKIKPLKADDPFGLPTGAGVIYGASGGVMESALRTGFFQLTGKNVKADDFKAVRGHDGIKRQVVKLCQPVKSGRGQCAEVRVAVCNEIKNAKIILDELKKNPKKYHFVEVMACPFGCIGGGGQPLPVSAEIRQKRADALYRIDKTSAVRLAHENPEIKKVYQEFFKDRKLIKKILHTSFGKKPRTRVKLSRRKITKQ